MFSKIRHELSAISAALLDQNDVLRSLSESVQAPQDDARAHERISILEGRIESILGQVEGELRKADGMKQAARNAEERSRGMEKRAHVLTEALALAEGGEEEDPFEAAARAAGELPASNGDGSEEGEVRTLPSRMVVGRSNLHEIRALKRR